MTSVSPSVRILRGIEKCSAKRQRGWWHFRLGISPWYLRQQALLVLAAFDPHSGADCFARVGARRTARYRKTDSCFLRGQEARLTNAEFATLAVLSRRAFPQNQKVEGLNPGALSTARKKEIAIRDPSFARQLSADDAHFFNKTARTHTG